MIVVERHDGVSTAKQHATLSILRNREYLAYLAIVVSSKSSKKRMPKLSIGCKGYACTADKKGESEQLDHLQKDVRSILIELVGISTLGCSFETTHGCRVCRKNAVWQQDNNNKLSG
jgi:hypothetical protein